MIHNKPKTAHKSKTAFVANQSAKMTSKLAYLRYNKAMIITIDKDLFSETLATASRFTSNKLSSVSSLQGVLMKGSKDTVSFYATNLTTFFTATLEIPGADSFQVII